MNQFDPKFYFLKGNLEDLNLLINYSKTFPYESCILYTGYVRYSLTNPQYIFNLIL